MVHSKSTPALQLLEGQRQAGQGSANGPVEYGDRTKGSVRFAETR